MLDYYSITLQTLIIPSCVWLGTHQGTNSVVIA
jgi:hypothetical protein